MTILFGFALQLVAIRALDEDGYSAFVFGLAIGNVANAIGAVVQPVVVIRALTDRPAFLPVPFPTVLASSLVVCFAGTALLGPSAGPLIAFAALLQIPLYVAVAVGMGRLQARSGFSQISVSLVFWSFVRIAFVAPFLLLRQPSGTLFVLALPCALLAQLALLAAFSAFRGIDLRPIEGRKGVLLASYGLWALFSWLLNSDAVYSRTSLSAETAHDYAIALTLGRQPLYLIAPLALVLLPVTRAGSAGDQRARLHAIGLAALGVSLVTLLVLGARPDWILTVLTGDSTSGDASFVRAYALIGSVGGAAWLLMTFLYALDRSPGILMLAFLVVVQAVLASTILGAADLLRLQALIVTVLVILLTWRARAATTPVRA